MARRSRDGTCPGAAVADLAVVAGVVVAGLLGTATRLWFTVNRAPTWWQDSSDYATSALAGLGSSDLWIGDRPPLMPLVLALSGGEPGTRFIWVQALIAGTCWAWLAVEVAWSVSPRAGALLAGSAVVAFSLADPVLMWDRQVLTETLTLGLLAAVCAAVLRCARSPSVGRAVLVVGVCLLWALTRDTVAAALVAAAAAVIVVARKEAVLAAAAVGVLTVGLITAIVATDAGRGDVPMSHVYFARVLPYPDRVAWFAGQGMPQAAEVNARSVAPPADGQPKLVAFAEDDAALAPWWRWFHEHGTATWRRYVILHPAYLVSEPRHAPERVYNNAEGSVAFYRPPDLPRVPVVTALAWPPTTSVVVLLAVLGWLCWRRRLRGPLLALAALLVVGSAAYALVAWHTDAMESARHLIVAGAMVRLALLLGVIGAVDRWQTAAADQPEVEPAPAASMDLDPI